MSDSYKTIVWATDGSDGAETALDEALRLAALSGGQIHAVHCDQRLNGRAGGWPALPDEDDRRVTIRRRVERMRAEGVPVELQIRTSHREAADTVADIAKDLGADVIVCGTRGLGALSGVLLGSFTQRLLHVAPCPVLAVGPRGRLTAAAHETETEAASAPR